MTINIGIIEDEELCQQQLIALIKQWEQNNGITVNIKTYDSSEDYFADTSEFCHAYFLDIQIDTLSGMDIARDLRQKGYTGEIIFLTAYQDYVFDGYNVQALNYILKPISPEQLEHCLQYIYSKLEHTFFTYRDHNKYCKIPYADIMYFSSANQYINIHTQEKIYKSNESLKGLLHHLPFYFVQCHRTTIVNLDFIEKIIKNDIILTDGTLLSISKKYLDAIRSLYLKYSSGFLSNA